MTVSKSLTHSAEHASRVELQAYLSHLLAGAGNYRILTTLADELLSAAAQRDLAQLDEKLYLEVFAPPETPVPRRAAAGR